MNRKNSQIFLVQEMSVVLLQLLAIPGHPRSSNYRVGLTRRTSDQDPICCAFESSFYPFVDFVAWVFLWISKLSQPSLLVGLRGLTWEAEIEFVQTDLPAEQLIIRVRNLRRKIAQKTAQSKRFAGGRIFFDRENNLELFLTVCAECGKAFAQSARSSKKIYDGNHVAGFDLLWAES